jgi:hypothetical protein
MDFINQRPKPMLRGETESKRKTTQGQAAITEIASSDEAN